jgi:D-alanyl-D-alanine carboxypeptidase/D-alanyl-D-alanine-endopeptidase (penicillin-binding protein 4)
METVVFARSSKFRPRALRLMVVASVALVAAGSAAQITVVHETLPDSVNVALRAARIPANAVAATVIPLSGAGVSVSVNDDLPMNPASLMKLATTLAGLELLGPQYTWRTQALATAPLRKGVLRGALWLRGSGDPRLVIEDVWLLVQAIRGAGVRELQGDLVLDRSAFEPMAHDPGAFDGQALRPYNAAPDALLMNYKVVGFHFVPDTESRQVRVYTLPVMAGMASPDGVRASDGACGDWRAHLGSDFSDPMRPRFRGAFPLACGDKVWHVNLLTPGQYAEAVFRQLWESSGGVWKGQARDGTTPPKARLIAQHESPPLSELIRDINKFSNNVMARQLFLTIGAEVSGLPANEERARRAVGDWLIAKGLGPRDFMLENGAGLSRVERLTSSGLARLLLAAYNSPLMPEFTSSLPLAGIDGTMQTRTAAAGSAHIKTGLLSEARGIAGYVLAASGRHYAVVALVNHANAGASREALDALLEWVRVQG